MEIINDLEGEIAVAILVERRSTYGLEPAEAALLIDRVAGELSRLDVENDRDMKPTSAPLRFQTWSN
ncbi:MAG: hypothetical protein KIT61_17745 [Pyrinomonadaceae bacterium]|jgi:hypothetical protein|nr:hypothetical protein [Blastocatellia bacterium]MCW5958429.1 hypothetical protein [Pyrinomonadaceae bacterium]